MRKSRLNKEQLTAEIYRQRDWISEHGGSLSAYIDRYGDPGITRTVTVNDTTIQAPMYGSGGTAIYKADTDALQQLEAEYQTRFGATI